jgi:uncharacterized membrane protein YedE/YeeE
MTSFAPVSGLIGGVLIGLAAIILMLTIGRIAGVCGIVVNAMSSVTYPAAMPTTVIAGLIVGVGATVGSGCTSGHGICGLARFSMRSVVATVTFMATGAATVFVIRHMI